MEFNGEMNCFITLKDHKENFCNNPSTRLINLAKNEIGRISKTILDRINASLCDKLKLNQWKNTSSVIEWFINIKEKNAYKFCMFDVKDFYPSITESLLLNALNFAGAHSHIKKKDIDVIMHARKSLLFNNKEAWVKQQNENFNVTMGAYDGAEVCEIVGTFHLSLLKDKYNSEEMGLYRDDGLAVFKNVNGTQAEKLKKDFQNILKKNGLDIVILCNMKVLNYLDGTFNLNDGSYRPYHKQNDEINYIHTESNRPPNIIKQLPLAIEKRLSNISSSKQIFDKAVKPYQEALRKAGYKYELKCTQSESSNVKVHRNRQRNLLWFNPPYSKSVVTNIGSYFLGLLSKHFPPHHKFRKLFNLK